jgi:formate--tetrahydrofolate ligase
MKSDLEIAQQTKMLPVTEIASSVGIADAELELYGNYKAKVKADILKRLSDRPQAKYIVVTAITPTPLGEGKTVTSIGLGQGLAGLRHQGRSSRGRLFPGSTHGRLKPTLYR